MSASKRAESALSTSSNELIDRQLNQLIEDDELKGARTTADKRTFESGGDLVDGQAVDDDEENQAENVAVMVRCRPLSASGANPSGSQEGGVVKVDEANRCVEAGERQFFYDQVFGGQCDNEQVYMRSARRLVDSAFRGYNCAIFLYGQTGTGKTYTHSSLTLAAFEHLFSLIQDSSKGARFLIRASYYELYNEEIRDLLAAPKARNTGGQKPLELRESRERGVYVKDLTCFLVNNLAELKKLKQMGDRRRTTAATKMNEHSSRSHSIFTITVETISTQAETKPGPASSAVARQAAAASKSAAAKSGGPRPRASGGAGGKQPEPVIRVGHLNLIDLAGSERQSKSGATGLALKEASRINLSLTCLSLVIRALTDKSADPNKPSAHIPYRNSKLTRLLSSSLGGNSKTVLIACISMARSNLDETLNTLRFASRTKQIKNRAVINEDPKDALLRKYRKQLEELRLKLSEQQQQRSQGVVVSDLKNGRGAISSANEANSYRRIEENLGASDANFGGKNNADDHDDDDDEKVKLNKQLELLKAKIMFGGENLLDKLELHERLLEASRTELEERRREEAKLRERLLNKKQTIEQVVQSKGSLESQLAYLDAKLSKAIELYKSSKLELRDATSEHEQLKAELLQTIKSTSKEIKYVDAIIEDFVPRHHLDLINAYAQYDDESDEWQIKYIALSGNNIVQTKRLVGGPGSAAAAPTPGRSLESPADGRVRRDRKLSADLRSAARRRKRSADCSSSAGNRPDPFLRL